MEPATSWLVVKHTGRLANDNDNNNNDDIVNQRQECYIYTYRPWNRIVRKDFSILMGNG